VFGGHDGDLTHDPEKVDTGFSEKIMRNEEWQAR